MIYRIKLQYINSDHYICKFNDAYYAILQL